VDDSTGARVLSGGFVLLNADMDCDVGFFPGWSHGMVLLHELGHVMNLAHVADPAEIMCPGVAPVQVNLDYGPGDSMGLKAIAATVPHA
jgi:hypothetical protein